MEEEKPKKRTKREKTKPTYLPAKDIKQVRDQYGRLVWVHNNVNPDALPRKHWPFSSVTSDNICMLVTEGYSLKEISKIQGMPPLHIIYKWSRDYKVFKDCLQQAREDRAHFYHDHAIDTAMATNDKDKVPVSRLQIDTLKWAAEKGNSGSYGAKQVIEGNPDKPVNFIIDTGVRRELIEVQAEVGKDDIEISKEEEDG